MAPRRSKRNASATATAPVIDVTQVAKSKRTAPANESGGSASTSNIPSAHSIERETGADSSALGASSSESRSMSKKRVKKRTRTQPAENAHTNGSDAEVLPKRRGTRGLLQKVYESPLDVLFEIFSYLDPLDLLRMTRTTKDLRQLLTSKSTASLWERARLRIEGLPPKLDELNEMQFANLVFDNHCHSCGKVNVKYAQWEVRLRLCKSCLDSGLIMTNDADSLTGHKRSVIMVTPKYKTTNKPFWKSQYFHISKFHDLVDDLTQVDGPESTTDTFHRWFVQKQQEYYLLQQECKKFSQWEHSQQEGRLSELSDLREQRFQSILEKLRSDGWSEELENEKALYMLSVHKSVNQPKALTERMWSNMREPLTEAMMEIREELQGINLVGRAKGLEMSIESDHSE